MPSAILGLRAFSLRPNEILLGDVAITLDAPRVLDRDVARRGIGVAGIDGSVRFLEGGRRAVWTPERPLAPGRYRFVMGDLSSATGAKLAAEAALPFSVVRSRARVPASVAVESIVRIRVGKSVTERLSLYAPAGPL